MNTALKWLVGFGASLLVVRTAYRIGYEDGAEENTIVVNNDFGNPYRDLKREPTTKKKPIFGGLRKKVSLIKDLSKSPDDFKFEAEVDGEELVIRAKRKE